MKAVVLHQYGDADELKLEEWPDPVAGEGEVLVRVAAASINPVDWKMRSGAAKERFPIEFPDTLGRDVSGIVRAVGPGVEGFAPGDKVFAMTSHTYAELCVVKASELAKVPEKLDLVQAAALPLVTITGEQLARVAAAVQSGQTILITGAAGAVGRCAVWTAKHLGAHVIAGVRAKQLQEAKTLGADDVLALDDKDAMAKLGLLDAIADTIGGETGEMLLAKVKPGGVYASVVGPPKNASLHPTVRVVPMVANPDPAHMVELAEQVAAKRLTIPIDRMLPLADAAKGHAVAEKGGVGKILLMA